MAEKVRTLQSVEGCPWCRATDRTAWGACQVCGRHYFVHGWARAPRRRRSFWWLAVSLGVVAALGAWMIFPFLPGPRILLFKRPTTPLTSDSPANQWSMSGMNLQQSRYVVTPSRHVEGRLVWSVDLGAPTRSAPVIVDNTIYIGGHFRLLALDAHTGHLLWEIPTTGPVHTSVAVAGGLLYLGLQDWRVLALDRRTGKSRWEFKTQNPTSGSPAVAAGIVYIGSLDGFLYALDAATGKLIWKVKTEAHPLSPPAFAEGTLFVGSTDGSLYALHARTGQRRLRFRTPERLQDTPVAANGLVYFPSGGQLYAVQANAREFPGQYQLNLIWAQFWMWQLPVPKPPGQPGGQWRFSFRHRPRMIFSAPAVSPETLYVGDLNGYLYARDALKGSARWQFQAEGGIETSPLILGSRVYFGTAEGMLYALDRAQGALGWKLPLGAPIQAAPVFASGRLYIRTRDGRFHAIE